MTSSGLSLTDSNMILKKQVEQMLWAMVRTVARSVSVNYRTRKSSPDEGILSAFEREGLVQVEVYPNTENVPDYCATPLAIEMYRDIWQEAVREVFDVYIDRQLRSAEFLAKNAYVITLRLSQYVDVRNLSYAEKPVDASGMKPSDFVKNAVGVCSHGFYFSTDLFEISGTHGKHSASMCNVSLYELPEDMNREIRRAKTLMDKLDELFETMLARERKSAVQVFERNLPDRIALWHILDVSPD